MCHTSSSQAPPPKYSTVLKVVLPIEDHMLKSMNQQKKNVHSSHHRGYSMEKEAFSPTTPIGCRKFATIKHPNSRGLPSLYGLGSEDLYNHLINESDIHSLGDIHLWRQCGLLIQVGPWWENIHQQSWEQMGPCMVIYYEIWEIPVGADAWSETENSEGIHSDLNRDEQSSSYL